MVQIAETRASAAHDPMTPRLMRVVQTGRETSDTFTFELANLDGEPDRSGWLPGQFNMIGLPGIGEVPISISGDPEERRIITHTIREVGNVTCELGKLAVGSVLTLRGPFGSIWPLPEAEWRNVAVIAGGVGLVPLLPVIHHLAANPRRFGRVTLIYGARTPEDVLFNDLMVKWKTHSNMHVRLTVDHPGSAWAYHVGLVTRLIATSDIVPKKTIAMVCGPEVMMRFTSHELIAQGMPPENIFLSMERNMKCGIGLCGHCQIRGEFVCQSGPVYSYPKIAPLMEVAEL